MLKDHNASDLTSKIDGKEVRLAGFVHSIRSHGKIIFIDLRDFTGLTQIVFAPENKEAYREAQKLSGEFVVFVKGIVKKRPSGMINKEIVSGEVEIEAKELKILSKAKTPPFQVDKDTRDISEKKRLKHRYIDLRSKRMLENLKIRTKVIRYLTDFLIDSSFLEIETPYITKGTPEGAREYVIPSRLHKGEFYVLPQSPQQFKQLLMVSGIERYFQIAKAFRDEDPRSDRQQEFTQLDIEMSYVDQEDILAIVEQMISEMVEDLFPDKKIAKLPFPRLTYNQAMKEYASDSPNMKENLEDPNELAFCWVTDFPLMEFNENEKKLVSTHHPFTAPNKEDLDKLDNEPENVRAQAYDLVLNGYEVAGGSIRISNQDLQKKIFQILGLSDQEIDNKFGHMLEAFTYGVPPHGGIASGLDRLVAEIANEDNIREVIAFPKTGDGRDLMMSAPSEIDQKQLDELGIKFTEKKDS
jgi:aspartyl-tRNA synthetase